MRCAWCGHPASRVVDTTEGRTPACANHPTDCTVCRGTGMLDVPHEPWWVQCECSYRAPSDHPPPKEGT